MILIAGTLDLRPEDREAALEAGAAVETDAPAAGAMRAVDAPLLAALAPGESCPLGCRRFARVALVLRCFVQQKRPGC